MKLKLVCSHLLSFLLFLIFSTNAIAQNCEAILGYVRDVTERTHVQQSYYSFKRFFCDKTFSSRGEAQKAGAQAGIILDGLPVSFGGHNNSSQWSQYQRSICENLNVQSSLYLSIREFVTTANEKIVDAWNKCVSSPGIHFWVEANAFEPRLATLVATYIPSASGTYQVPSEGLTIVPAKALQCNTARIGHENKKGSSSSYLDSLRSSVNCERQDINNEIPAVRVTLKSGGDDRTIDLPSMKPRLRESIAEAKVNENTGGRPGSRDGVIIAEDGWCFDQDPKKVQSKLIRQDNNNYKEDRMFKVKSLSPTILVFTVSTSPAAAEYVSRVVYRAYVTEHVCAAGER